MLAKLHHYSFKGSSILHELNPNTDVILRHSANVGSELNSSALANCEYIA